eukprot:GEMP01008972.1.p2 GENE.GEMP01008972.1~~GEMP01008972.1.p2  ORF type:complete len:230 (+),score=80.34 GEMP01008972.1:700-1389(+)
MARVQAQYLGGNSVVLDNCDTVGSVMVRIANLHHRFASDVVVVCPDTGKNLTDPPSQKTPALVSVVLKQEAESPADDLRLTLRLHAEQEDSATCARALDMLRRTGADGDAVFLDAASDGNVKAVKTLLSAGVNANKNVALIRAAAYGNKDVIDILLFQGADVNFVSTGGGTALMAASEAGHRQVVDILLSRGAQVDRTDMWGNTAWEMASKYGRWDVMEVLAYHGAATH